MNRLLRHDLAVLLSRWILGLVFIVAGAEKIARPELFALSIEGYSLIPQVLVNLAALIIPWIEVMCGIFLLGGLLVSASAAMLSGLLGMFIAAIISAILRGFEIDCGCFGLQNSAPVGWGKVFEDVALLLPGLHLMLYPSSKYSIGYVRMGERTPDETG